MYINCSVEVKAESDAICTSSNALKVLEAMPGDRVVFGPDRNLATWVAKRTKKTVIPWNGFCPVHEKMDLPVIRETMARFPGAYVMVHPECPPDVQAEADEILSTSQMLLRAGQVDAREFIIGTEIGLVEQLRQAYPAKTFHPAYEHTSCDEACACPFMKMTRLGSVARALETGEEEIRIPEPLARRALRSVQRMLDIGK
jgi:quinolinate synthase